MDSHICKNIILGIISGLICFCFVACKAKELNSSQIAKIEKLTSKVESKRYEFIPNTANPMGGRQVNLDYSYFLRMTNDTLTVNLPYFGRSYIAPTDPTRIGYDFTSTNFNYTIVSKKDKWEVSIQLSDTEHRGLQLFLSIGNTGYSDLRIQDPKRQSISYYGTIKD